MTACPVAYQTRGKTYALYADRRPGSAFRPRADRPDNRVTEFSNAA